MLCMTQYICAPLQSAGGFILEGDWTPTKTKLLQLTTYRGGSLISLQDKILQNTTLNVKNRTGDRHVSKKLDTCLSPVRFPTMLFDIKQVHPASLCFWD